MGHQCRTPLLKVACWATVPCRTCRNSRVHAFVTISKDGITTQSTADSEVGVCSLTLWHFFFFGWLILWHFKNQHFGLLFFFFLVLSINTSAFGRSKRVISCSSHFKELFFPFRDIVEEDGRCVGVATATGGSSGDIPTGEGCV